MARYIDADKIDYTVTMVGRDENAGYRAIAFESDIDELPTADVVPKSEAESWIIALNTVMEEIPEMKRGVARKIFEEIKNLKHTKWDWTDCVEWDAIAELEKKYIME